jgi:CheY-like chemotaxis protein
VLVVDDERAVGRVTELLLREWGHEARVCEDGPSAVAALDEGWAPDLVLLDRSMPGWPPQRTLSEIRKRASTLPVLFLTGQEVPADERAQVQQVLYKPLSMGELREAVDHWLAPARASG